MIRLLTQADGYKVTYFKQEVGMLRKEKKDKWILELNNNDVMQLSGKTTMAEIEAFIIESMM